MATINFVPSADASVVSELTKGILRGVLDDAGLPSCVITSHGAHARGAGASDVHQHRGLRVSRSRWGSMDRSVGRSSRSTCG